MLCWGRLVPDVVLISTFSESGVEILCQDGTKTESRIFATNEKLSLLHVPFQDTVVLKLFTSIGSNRIPYAHSKRIFLVIRQNYQAEFMKNMLNSFINKRL